MHLRICINVIQAQLHTAAHLLRDAQARVRAFAPAVTAAMATVDAAVALVHDAGGAPAALGGGCVHARAPRPGLPQKQKEEVQQERQGGMQEGCDGLARGPSGGAARVEEGLRTGRQEEVQGTLPAREDPGGGAGEGGMEGVWEDEVEGRSITSHRRAITSEGEAAAGALLEARVQLLRERMEQMVRRF